MSNWEAGRRQLTLERLMQLATLLDVSVTYLLGMDERVSFSEPVSVAALPVLHRTPVWTRSRGWALVNAIAGTLVFADKSEVLFTEAQEPVFVIPPAFTLSLRGMGEPLGVDDIPPLARVWVEPTTPDTELRGWYRIRGRRLVENEYGNRFYLDTYGVTGDSISSVATRPAAVSGSIAGEIADRSLKNYMPHMAGSSVKPGTVGSDGTPISGTALNGAKYSNTQISGGHISTTATTADGKTASVDL